MKTWDNETQDFVFVSEEKARAFLEEIASVCEKHGLSISHEDGHGAFIIEKYSAENITWLFEALEGYEEG